MMTLNRYLQNINKLSKVPQLLQGTCSSLGELWDKLISPLLPAKDVVLRWHKILMEYVDRPDAMFVIRGGNNAKKNEYNRLRRGFLTRTNQGYSFFYTDNFHAAYYLKMALDGYVPTVEELVNTYNLRQFPARFGRDTEEERVLMAMPRGKDPGFQTAGYKLSHIYNVGTDYVDEDRCLSLIGDIVDTYFPYGNRDDWSVVDDSTGEHYERYLNVSPSARSYLVAAFLRFVHPFNYFLVPKSTCSDNDVSENPLLISYVRNKIKEMYGTAYDEFLGRIMPSTDELSVPPADTPMRIFYSLEHKKKKEIGKESGVKHNTTEVAAGESSDHPDLPIGKFVQTVLRHLLEGGVVDEQEINRLLLKDYSHDRLGLNFAMLSVKRDIHNKERYYARPLKIRNKVYYLTSQWYVRHRSKLERWIARYHQ